jgi:hypothetical protein
MNLLSATITPDNRQHKVNVFSKVPPVKNKKTRHHLHQEKSFTNSA